jgi:hypothetical protein
MGLNRSLALAPVLLSSYGHPDFAFAPNPSVMSSSASGIYSYVRPLATIEPTAIQAHLPVNTQFGLNATKAIEHELMRPRYQDALIFIAWEHGYLDTIVRDLVKDYRGNPAVVPPWPENDYDSIFVLQLLRKGSQRSVSFRHEHEGLTGHLSAICPGLRSMASSSNPCSPAR